MKPYILFVEDEAPLCELLSLYFDHHGFHVSTAATVEQAKLLLDTVRFDLVILDLDLDGCDGLAVLNYVRAAHLGVPVVIFTGLDDDDALYQRALAGCAEGLVRKGGSLNGILAEVRRHISGQPARV